MEFKGLDYAKNQVEQFHKAFNHPIGKTPMAIAPGLALARTQWTAEELVEFLYATANNELDLFDALIVQLNESIMETARKLVKSERKIDDVLVDQMDALTDVNYFVQGSFVVAGVNPQPLFDIVQDANMAKLFPDGKPRFREEDGKVIKPDGWKAPEPKLAEEIESQRNGNGNTFKYKPGDIVKVRSDLELGSVYSMTRGSNETDTFVDTMVKFKGEFVTIKEMTNKGKYNIKEDILYNWTDEMFE